MDKMRDCAVRSDSKHRSRFLYEIFRWDYCMHPMPSNTLAALRKHLQMFGEQQRRNPVVPVCEKQYND